MNIAAFAKHVLAATLLLPATNLAAADVWHMPAGQKSLEFVAVGDPGNAPDARYGSYGAVGYTYQIGKYDVTAAQYAAFLNAVAKRDGYGLYDRRMYVGFAACGIVRSGGPGAYRYSVLPGRADFPVNCVTWADAARVCNWLHNGQPAGAEDATTTETGAYNINGAMADRNLMRVVRSARAKYWIPTEDEWYKAAYYRGGGTGGGYWTYPTRSNTAPINTLPDPGNHANFWDYYDTGSRRYTDPTNQLTPVGAFAASAGPYGTFDQGGNVWQWNETAVTASSRGLRGGSFELGDTDDLRASHRVGEPPTYASCYVGFRVARKRSGP